MQVLHNSGFLFIDVTIVSLIFGERVFMVTEKVEC